MTSRGSNHTRRNSDIPRSPRGTDGVDSSRGGTRSILDTLIIRHPKSRNSPSPTNEPVAVEETSRVDSSRRPSTSHLVVSEAASSVRASPHCSPSLHRRPQASTTQGVNSPKFASTALSAIPEPKTATAHADKNHPKIAAEALDDEKSTATSMAAHLLRPSSEQSFSAPIQSSLSPRSLSAIDFQPPSDTATETSTAAVKPALSLNLERIPSNDSNGGNGGAPIKTPGRETGGFNTAKPTTPRGGRTGGMQPWDYLPSGVYTTMPSTTPLKIQPRLPGSRKTRERTARRVGNQESQSIRKQLSVLSLDELKESIDQQQADRASGKTFGHVRNPHRKMSQPSQLPQPAVHLSKIEEVEDSGMDLRIENFSKLRLIGRGTYGVIQLVRYQNPPYQLFALKILDKRQQIQENEVDHVMNESHILKQVKFPFIVKWYGSFQDDQRLYILLEYVTGSDLYSYINEYPFDLALVRFFAAQIVLILEHLHGLGLVFRDLKPENLLIDWRGYLKLTDFSFAKELDDSGRTFTFCGSPCYMAPEIILQSGHGFAVDWWTLGVLMYEMVAGKPPWYQSDAVSLYDLILTKEPVFNEKFTDQPTIDIVRELLRKVPDERLGIRGAQEVREHPFFDGIDWDAIYHHRVKSPLPAHLIESAMPSDPSKGANIDEIFGNPQALTDDEQKRFVDF